MDKLPMCRICLVENVNMYVVVNKNLHELYEKLTDIPFVTKDSRPILACFFCCAKLKQCFRFRRKCLEAEELFAQMINEDYEPNPSKSQDDLHCCTGFINSPIVHVSIVDECETDSIAIKEEVPAICEGQEDVNEPKEEYLSDDRDLENLNNTFLGTEDIPPHQSESDSGGDVKIEVEEEQELSKKKRRAVETNRAPVTKKPKLDKRTIKQEDIITAQLKKNDHSNLEVIRTDKNCTSKRGTSLKKPNTCDQRSLNRVKKLTQYTRSDISEKPYECDVCQCRFRKKSYLKTHIRVHTGEKPYKCDVCQRSFRHSCTLTKHVLIHTSEKPYTCDVCMRSFRERCALINHIRNHHNRKNTDEKLYKCDVCQRSYSQLCGLVRHIRIHTGVKPYKCDVCLRSFVEKCALVSHSRTHTGEKPFKCDVCQRSFSHKCSLTDHIRIHIGKKTFKCGECKRSFNQKGGLSKHMRTHTGEKPFTCGVCQRSFSLKAHLTAHTRIHTGEKRYQCVDGVVLQKRLL